MTIFTVGNYLMNLLEEASVVDLSVEVKGGSFDETTSKELFYEQLTFLEQSDLVVVDRSSRFSELFVGYSLASSIPTILLDLKGETSTILDDSADYRTSTPAGLLDCVQAFVRRDYNKLETFRFERT